MSLQLFSKPSGRWLAGGVMIAIAVTGATVFYGVSQAGFLEDSRPQTAVPTVPVAQKVTALGRLEPQTEVIRLSAPLALDGDRIAELLVQQGDTVEADQVIAVLDSRDRLRSALEEAQERVRAAEARLSQVKAGAKTGEILAQEAAIARLQAEVQGELNTQAADIERWQAELRTARAEYDRFQQLYREGAIAASSLDSKRLAVDTAQAQLEQATAKQQRLITALPAQLSQAKATLSQIAEVRPVDVQAAQAEVDTAIAAAKRAETELNQAYIRAPISGQILKIHSRPGESISDDGIAELGQTDQMVVVAEVYQTDISKVLVGQAAVITGQAFNGQLKGTVSEVGVQVSRQNVFSNQPGENLDQRVVEVKIRLDPQDNARVKGLTNLQVQAAIEI